MGEIERILGRIAAARADGYGIVIRQVPEPDGTWTAAGRLGSDPELTAATASAVSGMYGRVEPHIQAEWMLESLARGVADLGGSFALASGTLPDLDPGNVLLAIEGGLVRGTALRSDRLGAGDLPRLADGLRVGLARLIEPAIEWIDSEGLRPAKTLWQAAADRLAQALVWCGRAFDRPDEALELTRLAVGLDGPDARLAIPVERSGDEYGDEFHLRHTCCLAYRTEGGELCQSCPLRRSDRFSAEPLPPHGPT